MSMSKSKSKSIYIEIRKWKLESRKWNGIIVLNVKRMKWWWNQNRKSKHIYYKLLDAHDEHAEKPTNINKNWRRIPKKINKKWIKECNTRILCVCVSVWAYSSFLPWWVWFFFFSSCCSLCFICCFHFSLTCLHTQPFGHRRLNDFDCIVHTRCVYMSVHVLLFVCFSLILCSSESKLFASSFYTYISCLQHETHTQRSKERPKEWEKNVISTR